MRAFILGRVKSIVIAAEGIRHVVCTQPNARIHLACTIAVVLFAGFLKVSAGDWCWLIAAVAAVWVAEAMNTALELLADATCPDRHPLVGRAKDVAAGAVLLSALCAAGIGTCVFGPRLLGG